MPEHHVIVKLDFSNAFNALRRDSMLEAVYQPKHQKYTDMSLTTMHIHPNCRQGNIQYSPRKAPNKATLWDHWNSA